MDRSSTISSTNGGRRTGRQSELGPVQKVRYHDVCGYGIGVDVDSHSQASSPGVECSTWDAHSKVPDTKFPSKYKMTMDRGNMM